MLVWGACYLECFTTIMAGYAVFCINLFATHKSAGSLEEHEQIDLLLDTAILRDDFLRFTNRVKSLFSEDTPIFLMGPGYQQCDERCFSFLNGAHADGQFCLSVCLK
jgi:hypothetical protein